MCGKSQTYQLSWDVRIANNTTFMRNLNTIFILVLSFVVFSCGKDQDDIGLNLEKVTGSVQKGPFLNGTAITISELTTDLTPTGKNFTSQILDNKGTFEIKNVALTSRYVELKADGFYFNEITNSNSTAQLTLYALSDLSNRSSLNVNVLSNLEKSRVDYLVSNGTGFSAAKQQAQTEILSIFEIEKDQISESEQLDISKPGDENAILLAVSVILQGHLSVSDLSELLANISTDIREDGQLNSQSLSSTLINNAKTINLATIRTNLENRYEQLGLNTSIPDFEKYVLNFIDRTDFEYTSLFEYPETGEFGTNILALEKINYGGRTYSMKAILPEGTKLKVKISGTGWFVSTSQVNAGWEYSGYNSIDQSGVFTSTRTGEIDYQIAFNVSDTAKSNNIKISVFENMDTNPTWTKDILVSNQPNTEVSYPFTGKYGDNILSMKSGETIVPGTEYSLMAILPSDKDLLVRIKMNSSKNNASWSVNDEKIEKWTGSPVNGNEIVGRIKGDMHIMPIIFSGNGEVDIQIETFEIADREVYLGTQNVLLTLK